MWAIAHSFFALLVTKQIILTVLLAENISLTASDGSCCDSRFCLTCYSQNPLLCSSCSVKNLLFYSKTVKNSSYYVNGDPYGYCVNKSVECSNGLLAVSGLDNTIRKPGIN